MLTIMDKLELSYYKDLTLNERINDKQEQQEHLAGLTAHDHCDIEGIEIFSRKVRKVLTRLAE